MPSGSKTPPPGQVSKHKQGRQQSPVQPQRPGVVQKKANPARQDRRAPVAPPVFRPQPVPRVLQAKTESPHQSVKQAGRAPVAPPVYRPQPVPKVLQPKADSTRNPRAVQTPRSPFGPPVQRPAPNVLQPKSLTFRPPRPASPPALVRPATPLHFRPAGGNEAVIQPLSWLFRAAYDTYEGYQHAVTFAILLFNMNNTANPTATDNGGTLAVELMQIQGTARVFSSNDNDAGNWEIGFVQVVTAVFLAADYENGRRARYAFNVMPIHDGANAGDKPWYQRGAGGVAAAVAGNATQVTFYDRPSHNVPVQVEGDWLESYQRSQSFSQYLVARRAASQDVRILKKVDWDTSITLTFDNTAHPRFNVTAHTANIRIHQAVGAGDRLPAAASNGATANFDMFPLTERVILIN